MCYCFDGDGYLCGEHLREMDPRRFDLWGDGSSDSCRYHPASSLGPRKMDYRQDESGVKQDEFNCHRPADSIGLQRLTIDAGAERMLVERC